MIVGGNYFKDLDDFSENYLGSIKLLSAETIKVLGFEPVVITGPKIVSGRDDIFYDNKNRRLYIIRPEVGNASTKSFVHGDIEKQKKEWEEKN